MSAVGSALSSVASSVASGASDPLSGVASSVISYAARSISWEATTLPDGTTYPAGVIYPDIAIEERHDDESVITENPVEHGSTTSDHAYNQQSQCELAWAWSPSGGPLLNIRPQAFIITQYERVLDLKKKFILLNVVTGKRQYQNMLIEGLSEITEEKTENLLSLRIFLREMIFTLTETTSLPSADNQLIPQKTAPTVNGGTVALQPASNFNTGQALRQFLQGP
jgi:hypothetical protein